MAGLIDEFGGPLPTERDARGRPAEVYGALVRTIAGQQLSVYAARAIWNKLLAHFDGRVPTPREILDEDPETLRAAAGFSRAKVAYLRSLAEHVRSGELELDRLGELGDDAIVAELVAVKGIGTWTAQVFLLAQLGQPDVVVSGDLGIRHAVRRAYGLDALPSPAEVERRAEPWRPHRSLACRVLWRSLDNEPATAGPAVPPAPPAG